MSDKIYDIKAFAQDPASRQKRTNYATRIHKDIKTREYLQSVEQSLGLNVSETQRMANVPESEQELEIHMQLDYKQSIELAEEELISNTLSKNKFELTKRRFNKDLVTLGIGAVKTNWNKAEGITVDYVDPACLVWSYTEDPNFEDIYYVGEVKNLSLPELRKEFPDISLQELEEIQKFPGNNKLRKKLGRSK